MFLPHDTTPETTVLTPKMMTHYDILLSFAAYLSHVPSILLLPLCKLLHFPYILNYLLTTNDVYYCFALWLGL
jgi:hypothetical protein